MKDPDPVQDLTQPSTSDVTESISHDLSAVPEDEIEDICLDHSDYAPPTPKYPHLNIFTENNDLARYTGHRNRSLFLKC